MTVNYEIKGILARLLATEDLVVENKKVDTACFNVHTRVLTLPMWERASDNVYSLLVAHEVGHARETPNVDWTVNRKIPSQFVNIVEDARVEKLMKRKYGGLAKTFYTGYRELHDEDFFQIGDDDVSTYNLADRANLYFKVGNFMDLNFTSEEKNIIDMIDSAETFKDVLDASEMLYKYCKKYMNHEIKIKLDSHEDFTSGSGFKSDFSDQQEGENDQEEGDEQSDSDDQSENQESGNSKSADNTQSDQNGDESENKDVSGKVGSNSPESFEPQVKTVQSLEEAIKKLANDNGHETQYIEIPKVNPNLLIIPNADAHKTCKEGWQRYYESQGHTEEYVFWEADKRYQEFKRSSQKEVSYLVKEFECRKAADSYARSSTARTGVLDCTKLHTYKYNEDLFKKVTTFADGKNHGLIFVIDWSGSMGNVLLDTIKQLYNLIWFCKKANIPFEVYAFTNDYPRVQYDANNKAIMPKPAYEKKDGVFHIAEWFSLMNILTSKVNTKTLEDQMKNIYRISLAYSRSCYTSYPVPMGWSLSGTPLNESLVTLHQILPEFQKTNKLQKVQCVILTDGEGGDLKYHKEYHRQWEDKPHIGTVNFPSGSFLRDRKTGSTYSLNNTGYGITDVLLHNLRDNFPTVNFIGIRVIESRDATYFMRRYTGYSADEYNKLFNSWKKDKSFAIKNSGYHTYFGISSSALSSESEFTVSEDATKSQIKNAFVKSLKSKKMNKKVLNEFIELIA